MIFLQAEVLVPLLQYGCTQLLSLCISVIGIKCLSVEVSIFEAAPNKDANSPEGRISQW